MFKVPSSCLSKKYGALGYILYYLGILLAPIKRTFQRCPSGSQKPQLYMNPFDSLGSTNTVPPADFARLARSLTSSLLSAPKENKTSVPLLVYERALLYKIQMLLRNDLQRIDRFVFLSQYSFVSK
jgi:hypothetical protein